MLPRHVGCVIYATWIGTAVGMVLGLPSMVLLSSVAGLAGAAGFLTGAAAGFLAGVLAVADTLGPIGRGAGQWFGCETGLLLTTVLVAHAMANGPGTGPATAADWVALACGFAYTAGVGFVAGRFGERAGRWSAGTR